MNKELKEQNSKLRIDVQYLEKELEKRQTEAQGSSAATTVGQVAGGSQQLCSAWAPVGSEFVRHVKENILMTHSGMKAVTAMGETFKQLSQQCLPATNDVTALFRTLQRFAVATPLCEAMTLADQDKTSGTSLVLKSMIGQASIPTLSEEQHLAHLAWMQAFADGGVPESSAGEAHPGTSYSCSFCCESCFASALVRICRCSCTGGRGI